MYQIPASLNAINAQQKPEIANASPPSFILRTAGICAGSMTAWAV
jgi:hypothetical protein